MDERPLSQERLVHQRPTARLNDAYQAAYEEMLRQAGSAHLPSTTKLSACWPDAGPNYAPRKGLLVIGRAINGFEETFQISDLRSGGDRSRVTSRAREAAESNRLNWLGARGRRGGTTASESAFWRIVAAVASALKTAEGWPSMDWQSCVAWTNLAKVAPAAGGNPGTRLYRAQLEGCAALLPLEVKGLDPRAILVLAGPAWCADYAAGMPWGGAGRSRQSPVLDAVIDQGRPWIFCTRPERKKEAPFKAEVISALEKLLA